MDYCDGWMPIGRPGEQNDLAESLKDLRVLCERVGRSFDSLELAVIGLPPSEDFAKRLLGIGFQHLIFSLPIYETDFEASLEVLESNQRAAQSDAFKRAHQAHLSALGGAERCSPWSCRRRCCAYLEASDDGG